MPEDPIAPPPLDEFSLPAPRNPTYEKLCALAKSAYRNDLETSSGAMEWEFAAAVTELNGHPMSSLLRWAGVKLQKPWWDRWALILSGTLLPTFLTLPMVLARLASWSRAIWVVLIFVDIAVLVLLYFTISRMNRRQLRWSIERCRDVTTVDSSAGRS